MTARELMEGVLIELNKENAPNVLLEDFNYFANKAINQYVNKRYNIYDVNQQTTDDLRVLKADAYLRPHKVNSRDGLTLAPDGMATYEVTLPSDYLHLLNCVCIYNVLKTYKCYNKGDTWRAAATRLTADAYSQVLDNFWVKPSYKRPYYYIHNTNIPGRTEIPTNPYNEETGYGTDLNNINTYEEDKVLKLILSPIYTAKFDSESYTDCEITIYNKDENNPYYIIENDPDSIQNPIKEGMIFHVLHDDGDSPYWIYTPSPDGNWIYCESLESALKCNGTDLRDYNLMPLTKGWTTRYNSGSVKYGDNFKIEAIGTNDLYSPLILLKPNTTYCFSAYFDSSPLGSNDFAYVLVNKNISYRDISDLPLTLIDNWVGLRDKRYYFTFTTGNLELLFAFNMFPTLNSYLYKPQLEERSAPAAFTSLHKYTEKDSKGKYILKNENSDLFSGIKMSNGLNISNIQKTAQVRYGNASAVRMEIRYGTDTSVFTLDWNDNPESPGGWIYIDYVKAPQHIRLTQKQVDLTEDTSLILEFPDYVCQEILNELVNLIMEHGSDPRLQTRPVVSLSIANPAQALAPTTAAGLTAQQQ